MKASIKKLVPKWALNAYHRALPAVAAAYYGRPSERLVVIGVTGTNGKTTVANMASHVLEAADHRVGFTTTANFSIAGKERLNDTKMTMLGRGRLQKMLADMVRAGCNYAVIETSSEGIAQNRHLDIEYDVAVFTNLTPEHIESHGSYEAYKEAKGRLFSGLSERPRKIIADCEIPKAIVVNLDSPEAGYFLAFAADQKFGFTCNAVGEIDGVETVVASDIDLQPHGSSFVVRGQRFDLRLPGLFNVENALAAIAVGLSQGVGLAEASRGLAALWGVPGRMEFIDAGQPYKALIDYAPEPESLRRLYEALLMHPRRRTVHVLGSAGGGRDRARRPILGSIAARNADVVIVTNEDPYDDDPREIMEQVAAGARDEGKRDGENLFIIEDRRAALDKAVSLAQEGDLVLATGKGAEQAICTAHGGKMPWDERDELRAAIQRGFRARRNSEKVNECEAPAAS
jgi:UDP-N-acetylmuramoyl-L-alanyl-D-glutamate--2,6-diaminopimelate ligase